MKKIMLTTILLAIPLYNHGHQPHLVTTQYVLVKNPEISQAFYATEPAQFVIEQEQPFELYVQLVRPAIGPLDKQIRTILYKNGVPIHELDGTTSTWIPFHEPFANDDYYQGPEYTADAQGRYEIKTFGEGKYVIVIGKKEAWPISEIIRTLYLLPSLKIYFGKSPLMAYWNLSGALAAAMLIIGSLGLFAFYKITKKIVSKA